MAAARLVLLALSVALFAAVWSGDQPQPRNAPVVRRSTASRPIRPTRPPMQAVSRSQPVDLASPLPARWHAALPWGVTAGEYLLVETTGQSQRVRITAELLQTLGQDPDVRGEPLYHLTSAEHPAYLVRITRPADRIAVATRVDGK